MRCRHRPVRLEPTSGGMMGDSLSVLTEGGRDDHRLNTLVKLENSKAEA
jgi:hypothetical protein